MKNLYLLEGLSEETLQRLEIEHNTHIIAFDYRTHRLLSNNNIRHNIIDDFLDEIERTQIYQFCFSLWNWYDNIDDDGIKFHSLNLLGIIDRNELHEALMTLIPKIHVSKKVIDKIKPDNIFASTDLQDLLSSYSTKIKKIQNSRTDAKNYFTLDKIDVAYEIGGFRIGIKMRRRRYELLKKILEKIVCNVYGLRKNNPNKKKIVLIEFNPEVFSDLLTEIDRQGLQAVLINFRRPAAWSKNAIAELRKTHSHVALPEDWIDKDDLSQITSIRNAYLRKINQLFHTEKILSKIFTYNGIQFDSVIKKIVIGVLEDRLEVYLQAIHVAESINKDDSVTNIITLNLSGETEKIFSSIKSKNKPILLQHAFSNYTTDISYLDTLDDFHLIQNKIAVWGNEIKNYLIENKRIQEDKIIVTGSPKYDSFISMEKIQKKIKTVLVTPRPIIHHVEGLRVELYEKYEKTLDKILEMLNEPEIKIIFKLHPQQIEHNQMIREYLMKKNPKIKIIQFTPIKDLLINCDLHVNIAPDNFDASSVILEAMILERPTLNIQLQSTRTEFQFMRYGAVKTCNHESNIQEHIKSLLYENVGTELLQNARNYLPRYISHHGNASKTLVETLSM